MAAGTVTLATFVGDPDMLFLNCYDYPMLDSVWFPTVFSSLI